MGTPNGMGGLVAEAGYDYRGIEVGSFERSMDLDSLRHNAKSAGRSGSAPAGPKQFCGSSRRTWWWAPAATPAILW